MYDVNRYIANMILKEGWGKEIRITRKDYELLVKIGHAKESSPGYARYRGEYTLVVG